MFCRTEGPAFLALLLLHALSVGAPAPGEGDFLAAQPQEPRRTFCSVGRDAHGTRISFTLPLPHAAVPAGPMEISVLVSGDTEVARSGPVILYVDAPTHRPVLMQAASSGESTPGERRLSAMVDVQCGSHTLQAALLDADGVQTGAVAFTSFMARGPDFDLEQAARAECRGEKTGVIRTATSKCDALLQLARERLTARRWGDVEVLVADVIQISAQEDRVGDMAHATHILPYLLVAQALLAQEGRAAEVPRVLGTVARLQPGYELPSAARARDATAKVTVDPEAVANVDLSPVLGFVCEWTAAELVGPSGMIRGSAAGNPGGHYRLLAHLASQMQGGLIVEMGSMHGASALALGLGGAAEGSRVVTYNIVDDFSTNARACGRSHDEYLQHVHDLGLRVEWRLEDILSSESRMDELLTASLIHIDINHHGDIEDAILQFLAGNEYKGLVLLDDIYLNEAMDRVWGSIRSPVCKHDLTDLGHTIAGSGLVDFSCSVSVLPLEPKWLS